MMFGGSMGPGAACARNRADTTVAVGAAADAIAITCGGFAATSTGGPGTRPAGTSGAHPRVSIDPVGASSAPPGGAISYLIRIFPARALVRGVTIVAAADPAGITLTTGCADAAGRPGGSSPRPAPAGGFRGPSPRPAQAAAGDRPHPPAATCTFGPATAVDAATAGLHGLVRLPVHRPAGTQLLPRVTVPTPRHPSA